MEMYSSIKLYIKNIKTTGYANNTILSYEVHLRNYYSYCRQNGVDYRAVSVKQILEYRQLLAKRYSNQSINCKMSVIKSYYNYLIDTELATTNPIRSSMYIRHARTNPKPLSKENKHLFLSYIEQKEKHIELGFKILFDTGIRISELVKLKKENIKVLDGKVFLYIHMGKNSKDRIVPLFDAHIIKELLEYIEGNFNGYLFNYSTRAYQLHAEEFSKKFNVSFTVHMARHTFATEKVQEGMRIDILRKILGHKDIRTTMYYIETDDEEILKLGGIYND